MPDETALPFHSLSFTLVEDRRPRASFRMTSSADGLYELHVEKGSASNPSMQFTRQVPVEVAQRLKDSLQEIGAFGWDESYGSDPAQPMMRWTLTTVFKEGVFSVSSRGGNDVPQGFDLLLEELYRLDFPRPAAAKASAGGSGTLGIGSAINSMGLGSLGSVGGMSAGDLGAFSATGGAGGFDFSQMAGLFDGAGIPGFDAAEMRRLLSDPQALQRHMREEYKRMSPEERSNLLDALSSTGLQTREWWERFFGGLL